MNSSKKLCSVCSVKCIQCLLIPESVLWPLSTSNLTDPQEVAGLAPTEHPEALG